MSIFFRDNVNVNHELIVYITGSFAFYLIFTWANAFKTDRDGGAWCKHRRHVNDLIYHRFFDEAFRERVCKCYDNPHLLREKALTISSTRPFIRRFAALCINGRLAKRWAWQ